MNLWLQYNIYKNTQIKFQKLPKFKSPYKSKNELGSSCSRSRWRWREHLCNHLLLAASNPLCPSEPRSDSSFGFSISNRWQKCKYMLRRVRSKTWKIRNRSGRSRFSPNQVSMNVRLRLNFRLNSLIFDTKISNFVLDLYLNNKWRFVE